MRRLITLVAAALVPTAGAAQVQSGKWDVGTHLGWTTFDKGTGIGDAPFLGLDATYHGILGQRFQGLDLGLGVSFAASRPETIGDQFPVVAMDFQDTTFLMTVAQPITLLQFGVHALVGAQVGAFRVYGLGGTGGYSITTNARQNNRNETFVHQLWQAGAGVNYALRPTIGLRLEGRSVWFTGFDRDRLDPTIGYVRDTRVGDALPPPHPEPKRGLAQNWQFSLIFNYIPTRVGGDDSPRGDDR